MTAFGESTLAAARKVALQLREDLRRAVFLGAGDPGVLKAYERSGVLLSNIDQVIELERVHGSPGVP